MKNTKRDLYIAYHEAGHAVVGWKLFGLKRIKIVTIIPDKKDNTLGHVENKKIMQPIDYEMGSGPTIEGKIMYDVMESFAGHVAERKIKKRANNIWASSDFHNVIDLIGRLPGGYDTKAGKHLQDYLYRRTELLIEENWNFVKAVAKEVLKKKRLAKNDFEKVIDEEEQREIYRIKSKSTLSKTEIICD